MGSSNKPRQDTAEKGRAFFVLGRVGLWLPALALLPLAGAAWFAAGQWQQASDVRANAGVIEESVGELVDLSELRTLVTSEESWVAAGRGVVDLGIGLELVREFTGIDIAEEIDTTQSRVDELVHSLRLGDIERRIIEIRTDDGVVLENVLAQYQELETDLARLNEETFDELLRAAGEVGGAEQVIATSFVLESSAAASQSVAFELTGYFGVQFAAVNGATSDFDTLVEQFFIYNAATIEIARLADSDSAALRALDQIQRSEADARFQATVDELVSSLFTTGPPVPDPAFASLLADIDTAAAVFEAGAISAELHLGLVVAAGEDVTAASGALTASAEADKDRVVATIAMVVLASLAFAFGVARAIVRPLRLLAESAERLRSGAAPQTNKPTGPIEVRKAALALTDAAAHLQLAERQATALANGQLTHAALKETAPGGLGVSLQNAVKTLASSMAQREEFRVRLSHEASHDGLTQLPNRNSCLRQLQQGLARVRRTGETLAVMFVDLDGFKDVNDHHGHPVGDEVLEMVSNRLIENVREGDHVGRFGGDEFLVLAEPVEGAHEAVALAERLLEILEKPMKLRDITLSLTGSLGIAIADGDSRLTADEILRDSDLAVYKAKSKGRGQICLCDDGLRSDFFLRADMDQALRKAIDEDELTLHFQPIVDATTLNSVALEALVRWNRPSAGLLPPGDFIPHAERSDLVIDIDQWVLSAVVRQLVEWSKDPAISQVPVAVNISGRHLAAEKFVANILTPVLTEGIDPAMLVVEVTESAFVEDLEGAAARLQALRNVGVRVAIDDYGTGYTSLATLQTLPVDILKVDRTFTADDADPSLLKLIIDTGHLLGTQVTAEGIETPMQAQRLLALGCDNLQGYLYGRPVTAEKLTDEMRRIRTSQAVTSGALHVSVQC